MEDFFGALVIQAPAINADWNVLSAQPDLVLRQPGFYDAQAQRNSPSLVDPFSVTFVWLGSGAPGGQPFEIYNANFSTLFIGQTVVVPEPGVASLGAVALLAALFWRRMRKINKHSLLKKQL